MPRPTKPRPPPLLFADLFGLTAVDARGVARSKPSKHGFSGFDAKAPHLAVRDGSYHSHLFDAALRPVGEPYRQAGALLPEGGGLLTFTAREGRLGLRLGDALIDVPDARRELTLALGPPRGTFERDFPRDVVLAPDGGFALPLQDRSVRRHVATLRRRLHDAGRAGGVGVRVRSFHAAGGKRPKLQLSLWGDGGDEGPLAHCVMGAAVEWNRWASPLGLEGLRPTGGWVVAARTADVDELVDALATLDAHGLALRHSVQHWAQVCGFAGARPFTDAAAEVFVRVLLDPAATPGAQREAALRARATPWEGAALLAALAALRETSPSHDREVLVGRLVAGHRGERGRAMLDAMIAAQTTDKGLSYTGAALTLVARVSSGAPGQQQVSARLSQ